MNSLSGFVRWISGNQRQILGEIMSNTSQFPAPMTVDSDSPYNARPSHVSDEWKLTAVPTVDGPSPTEVNLAQLHTYVSPIVAARLGVPSPSATTETDAPDYSDGYGGTYAVGE